ncbi:peptidoglycan recognition protein family protein [Rubrivirga sp.]|uniref:peptidoglycan recognition protein family protein n=1 Tax=Rubrivirga sp. TaxID=1885344 RepID=UPI003C79243E
MRAALLLLSVVVGACASSQAPANRDGLPTDLSYLTRAEWGANPPTGPMRPHTPDQITVHHTYDTHPPSRSNADKLRSLQAFSVSDGPLGDGSPKAVWPDVPYHYYIAADGQVVEGRDVRFEGETNTTYPLTGHIQIVVEGNFEETEPTPAQMSSLTRLVVALAQRWEVPADAVASHLDRAPGQTACPGENLYQHLPALRTAVLEAG